MKIAGMIAGMTGVNPHGTETTIGVEIAGTIAGNPPVIPMAGTGPPTVDRVAPMAILGTIAGETAGRMTARTHARNAVLVRLPSLPTSRSGNPVRPPGPGTGAGRDRPRLTHRTKSPSDLSLEGAN